MSGVMRRQLENVHLRTGPTSATMEWTGIPETFMCVEKERLEVLCDAADGLYRKTVAALDQQADPGSVRRAIRVANQAWSAHSNACKVLNEHLVEHGCGHPEPVRRPR
jgi:hypothetical protein